MRTAWHGLNRSRGDLPLRKRPAGFQYPHRPVVPDAGRNERSGKAVYALREAGIGGEAAGRYGCVTQAGICGGWNAGFDFQGWPVYLSAMPAFGNEQIIQLTGRNRALRFSNTV